MSEHGTQSWNVNLTLVAPFYWSTDDRAELGIDGALPLNKAGLAVLPGTILRGLCRDLWCSIADVVDKTSDGSDTNSGSMMPTRQDLDRFLGAPSEGSWQDGTARRNAIGQSRDFLAVNNEPNRGLLDFSDLVSTLPPPRSEWVVNSRIALDPEFETVAEGQLRTLMLPWPTGKEVQFSGKIRWFGGKLDEKRLSKLLELAENGLSALGVNKGVGFGRIAKLAIEASEEIESTATPSAPIAPTACGNGLSRFDFRFSADRPLMVSSEQLAANHLKSGQVIPGGALKAALADTLSADEVKRFSAALSAMRFTHATVPQARPTLPLSTMIAMKGKEKEKTDILGKSEAEIMELGSLIAQDDWKYEHWGADTAEFDYETRTRVRIDYATGLAHFAADELGDDVQSQQGAGDLFTHSLLRPQFADGNTIEWRFSLYFDVTSDLAKELAQLLLVRPLRVGKTQAILTVHLLETDEETQDERTFSAKATDKEDVATFAFMLSSDSCLLPTAQYASAMRDSESMIDAHRSVYSDQFKMLFPNVPSLSLIDHFAAETLIGGYQAMRFQLTPGRYMPWVLTRSGSCFLLSCAEADGPKVREILEAWQKTGIPIPFDVPDPAWKHCPFVPENGYGCISPLPIATENKANGAKQ